MKDSTSHDAGESANQSHNPTQETKESRGKNDGTSLKKRKRTHKRPKVPQLGDEGYLTPTQLRNARKRRAKQQQERKQSQPHNAVDATLHTDPSQQYLSNPRAAPTVRKAKAFFHTLRMDFPIVVGPCQGWRTVSKLAVRPSDDGQEVAIGLFAPNSHRLIPVPQCVAHHPSINTAVALLERTCRKLRVQPFDETTGKGHLRHVALNVERSTGKVQITLVWNSDPFDEDGREDNDSTSSDSKGVLDALCQAIIASGSTTTEMNGRKRRRGRKEDSPSIDHDKNRTESQEKVVFGLHSLWVHFNSSWKHANAIFSHEGGPKCWKHYYGPSCITEILNLQDAGQDHGVPLQFPPNVFRQANLDGFTQIVAQVRKRLHKFQSQRKKQGKIMAPSCLELYGGVGTIGLNVADLTSSLVSSDENPFNRACFMDSAAKLPTDISRLVSYQSKNATDMIQSHALDKAEVVIVDPPRKGLDDVVLHALCTNKAPELLVYVSCGFDAFQRDCSALLQKKWKLEHAEGHVLFPGSDAIETLAFFVRKEEP